MSAAHPQGLAASETESAGEDRLFRLLDEWENLLRLLGGGDDNLEHLDALLNRREELGHAVAECVEGLRARWPEAHPHRLWLRAELATRSARISTMEDRLGGQLGEELGGLRARLNGLDHTRRTLVGYGRRPRPEPRRLDTER
ncbi:MAG: hypothetical protein H6678_03380 [Candidatus Delongbacteria bacterium]|nr:hypothetical protein [Candidatus Delongbacteria bacterium]